MKHIQKVNMRTEELEQLHQEIELCKIMSEDPHPNIATPIDFFEDACKFTLVMELVSGGNLFEWLKTPDKMRRPECETIAVFCKLVDALCYLHSRGILHRDIKLENILITTNETTCQLEPKLIDFGLSTVFFPGQTSSE